MDRQAKTAKSVATGKQPVSRRARPHTASDDRTTDQRLADAVAQQAATAEILRVMSASPSDVQPTVDAVAKHAARLCRAPFARVFLAEGDLMRPLAHYSADGDASNPAHAVPLNRTSISGRATLERATIHHADVVPLLANEYPDARENVSAVGCRAVLAVPLMHQGEAHGAIFLWRREPGLFAPDQVALVETFATQAAIAIAHVRLFHATREALEQQTATSEILRVISSSPTDVQPVFETIAANALRLCDARFSTLFTFDGELIHIAAHHNMKPEGAAAFRAAYPSRPSRGGATHRAVLTADIVQIADVLEDLEYEYHDAAKSAEYRSALSVPMLRDGAPIGTITVYRDVAKPFPVAQIELLKTFAEQAVIAIENVRLFKALESRNAALIEALEQQTATSDILRVISQSQADVQPVFDTIVASTIDLCRASMANVYTFDGELIHLAAFVNVNPEYSEAISQVFPRPPGRDTAVGRAILSRNVVEIPDLVEDREYAIGPQSLAGGFRSILAVPLMRDKNPIGGIVVGRTEPGPFPEQQIALLQTFADQGVIAIENARLLKELQARNADLTESLEQQTATSEILRVISRSQTDVQPVFDTIASAVLHLCEANSANVFTFDGTLIHVAALVNTNPAYADELRGIFPRPPGRDSAVTRAILTRRVCAVPDVSADKEYTIVANSIAGGFRSALAVPLLRDGNPIGAIAVGRREPGSFPDAQITLLQTFADQAVIAIENVRLFNDLEARNNELRVALEQQTATSELLKVIGRSAFELEPVFQTLAESAVRLCAAERGLLFRFDGQLLRFAVGHNVSPELREFFERNPIAPGRDSNAGRAALERRTVHNHDVLSDPEYSYGGYRVDPYRTVLAIPMLRADELLGVIVIYRHEVRPFTDSQIALMETFADQAAIAIENVRLFTELESRNRDLTEALEQQTATSEILRVISRSQTDVQPVFDTIAQAAHELCRAKSANVFTYDGKLVHLAAAVNVNSAYVDFIRRVYPRPPGRETGATRAILMRRVVEIHDVLEDHAYAIGEQSSGGGFRSVLAVPLLRDGNVIGAIAVGHADPGPFPQSQIALLQTFADQAVIAIENVRLFDELETRTKELTRSVGELRALGEVGQAVSSTLDLETVLSTIVSRATQLTGMDAGAVYEYDEAREEFDLHTAHRLPTELAEALRAMPIRKGEGALGRLAVTGEPVQVRDIMDEASYQSRLRALLVKLGYRSLLAVPLLREDHLLGGLMVYRRQAGEFAADVIALLQTFATQSALAIQNARLFREIEVKGRQLEIASKHKSEFLANMSHELRTPLNAIIGFSEVLGERFFGEINDKQAEYVNDIMESGRHLLALINDILDLSKVEAGRMELNAAEFEVATAIGNTLSLLRERAQRRSIALASEVDPHLGSIRADERKVKQVLLNLLSNALKFTPEGGAVVVRARAQADHIEIGITDTGVGIASADQATVFEEFRQVGATAHRVEGTGLGLAISRKFIELHGGTIRVESEPGRGSTFTFTLPRR